MANQIDGKQWLIYALGVVVLAAITLTGIALVSEFGSQLRTTTSASQDSITLDNNTAVLVGASGTYPYLQTLTSCVNSSDAHALDSALYSVTEGGVNGGFITLLPTGAVAWDGEDVNCSLTYRADTTAQGSADAFIAGLAIFGTFMVIIVLSLVGKIIIGIFKKD